MINRLLASVRKSQGMEFHKTEVFSGFRFDLDGDGRDEYFVEVDQSATGNCNWAIYSDQPARFRGLFFAKYFFVHARTGRWSAISTWTRQGWQEAGLDRLEFRQGQYTAVSESIVADNRPAGGRPFLDRMGMPRCVAWPFLPNGLRATNCYDD
jgi:hypothetical protein